MRCCCWRFGFLCILVNLKAKDSLFPKRVHKVHHLCPISSREEDGTHGEKWNIYHVPRYWGKSHGFRGLCGYVWDPSRCKVGIPKPTLNLKPTLCTTIVQSHVSIINLYHYDTYCRFWVYVAYPYMGLITDLASHHVRSVMKPKLLFIKTTYGSIIFVSISRILVDVLFHEWYHLLQF